MLIGDSCQYWLELKNQKLSSPQNYFADGDGCEWLIIAPKGHIISLEFDHFNVSRNIFQNKNLHLVKYNILYLSYMIIGHTLLHYLMECVIKLKNYKHYLAPCPMIINGSFLALDVTCLLDLLLVGWVHQQDF